MLRPATGLLFLVATFAAAQSATPSAKKPDASAQTQSSPSSTQKPSTSTTTIDHKSASTVTAQTAPSNEAAIPPTTPVITLMNFCEAGVPSAKTTAAPVANCKKVITKEEFDRVINAVIPKSRRAMAGAIPMQVKQSIARQYAMLLVMANAAEERGYPGKDPNTETALRLSRLEVLAQALNEDLQEKTTPADAEIEKYYTDNPTAYTEATLERLYIPKNTPGKSAPADIAAKKTMAEKLRARAAAGEDFAKLQKDAYSEAGITQTPPSVELGARRRGLLPPDQDAPVFALPTGGVSQLFESPAGWYVYKIESKRSLPLSDVRAEILHKLQPEKLADARKAVTESVKTDLNPAYFGPEPKKEPEAEAPKTQNPGEPK